MTDFPYKVMPKVEILKDSDPKKIAQWERVHDKRKHYRCERCGAEWKCEYFDNKFESIQDDCNGKPDILCQLCGKATVKEVIMRQSAKDHYCGECEYFVIPSACIGKGPEIVHIENPAVASYCNEFKEKGVTL